MASTYIDFKNKCVFNGSDLGKEFSAKAILDQISTVHASHEEKEGQQIKENPIDSNLTNQPGKHINENDTAKNQKEDLSNVMNLLLKPEQNDNHLPYDLLKKKRKKQSRGLHL